MLKLSIEYLKEFHNLEKLLEFDYIFDNENIKYIFIELENKLYLNLSTSKYFPYT